MKKVSLLLAAAWLVCNQASADTCADLRSIQTQSASHFDGWKKDAVANGRAYASAFLLDGAASCGISGDSSTYSCLWAFASPAALGSAYDRLVEQVKACPPLQTQAPGIINDKPDAREQDGVRQQLEVTGFDYADAGVMLLVGQLRGSGAKPAQARNELKLTFVRTSANAGPIPGPSQSSNTGSGQAPGK